MSGGVTIAVMMVGVLVILVVFTFVAVVSWSDQRRRERESYYRHETLKKLAEQPGPSADKVLEAYLEQERVQVRRRREGLKLGGLVTFAAGAGITILLRAVEPEEALYMVGSIPILIGVALLFYAYVLAPRNGGRPDRATAGDLDEK